MDQLIEFLKNNDARITYLDRWMYVDGVGKTVYTVYQRKHNARKTLELYSGEDLQAALAVLEQEQP